MIKNKIQKEIEKLFCDLNLSRGNFLLLLMITGLVISIFYLLKKGIKKDEI